MYRSTPPNLLTPPRENEEVYPFRRAWPSVILEAGSFLLFVAGLVVTISFLGIEVPQRLTAIINLTIAVFPALIWIVASSWRENFARIPRTRLNGMFVLVLLAANAVGLPLTEWINPAEWLSLEGTVNRVIGYAFTVGIIHEGIKYIVLRFWVWPNLFRTRYDSIAYATTAATAYATVENLVTPGISTIAPVVFSTNAFHTYVVHLSASLVVSYGLSELHFSGTSLFLLPLTLLTGVLLTGVGLALRSGIINTGFFLGVAVPNILFGFVFSVIFVTFFLASIAFVYNVAERRESESYRQGEYLA